MTEKVRHLPHKVTFVEEERIPQEQLAYFNGDQLVYLETRKAKTFLVKANGIINLAANILRCENTFTP